VSGPEKYFIPRNELLKLFLEDIKKSKKIKILYSSSCESVGVDEVGRVTVSITNDYDTSSIKKMSPDLILGCDGINSIVRTWLASSDANADNFTPVSLPSEAAGLRYKMLTLKNR
jgi:kynurenine 3-monooxygenase